jgi:hypothetical protein
MSFYRPVVWLGAHRAQAQRIHEAMVRYCQTVLGDSDPIIGILPDEEADKFVVLVASSKFADMPYSTRLNSIWDFLFSDPDTSKEELFEISRIMPESE